MIRFVSSELQVQYCEKQNYWPQTTDSRSNGVKPVNPEVSWAMLFICSRFSEDLCLKTLVNLPLWTFRPQDEWISTASGHCFWVFYHRSFNVSVETEWCEYFISYDHSCTIANHYSTSFFSIIYSIEVQTEEQFQFKAAPIEYKVACMLLPWQTMFLFFFPFLVLILSIHCTTKWKLTLLLASISLRLSITSVYCIIEYTRLS